MGWGLVRLGVGVGLALGGVWLVFGVECGKVGWGHVGWVGGWVGWGGGFASPKQKTMFSESNLTLWGTRARAQ